MDPVKKTGAGAPPPPGSTRLGRHRRRERSSPLFPSRSRSRNVNPQIHCTNNILKELYLDIAKMAVRYETNAGGMRSRQARVARASKILRAAAGNIGIAGWWARTGDMRNI